MRGGENHKQKEGAGERQVLSTMERMHGGRRHLEEQRKFEECNRAS